MATVTVDFNFASFRIKVQPNTVLNDVLTSSLRHYKLSEHDLAKDSCSWILLHNDKPVPLDLPWRFMNLSTGVKLELKQVQRVAKDDSTKQAELVRMKFQVPGYDSVIERVNVNANLKSILEALARKHSWSLSGEDSKLQVFSKVLYYHELTTETLSSLGFKESAVIKLFLAPSKTIKLKTNQQDEALNVNHSAMVKEEINERIDRELHKVCAFLPAKEPILSQIKDNGEEDYELTVAHARIYQQILSKQTGSLGGPMLSKKMRENQAENIHKPIEECDVRVRFSNFCHLEVSFAPEDDIQEVYEIVAKSLIDENLKFNLCLSHPYKYLPPTSKRLVEDLGFGRRTLLLFESDHDGPYLKESILQDAKEISEAADVKLDQSESSLNQVNRTDSELENHPSSKNKAIPSAASGKAKVPKWLKLSKK